MFKDTEMGCLAAAMFLLSRLALRFERDESDY